MIGSDKDGKLIILLRSIYPLPGVLGAALGPWAPGLRTQLKSTSKAGALLNNLVPWQREVFCPASSGWIPCSNETRQWEIPQNWRFQWTVIWCFPEMGVPPNHPFLDGMFPSRPSSYGGTPIDGNPHMNLWLLIACRCYFWFPEGNLNWKIRYTHWCGSISTLVSTDTQITCWNEVDKCLATECCRPKPRDDGEEILDTSSTRKNRGLPYRFSSFR